MTAIIVTLPILPGKTETWRRFRQELHGSRRQQYVRWRQRLGVVSDRMTLVETTTGTAVTLRVEAIDLGQVASVLAVADDPFVRWFRGKLDEIHGLALIRNKFDAVQSASPAPARRRTSDG